MLTGHLSNAHYAHVDLQTQPGYGEIVALQQHFYMNKSKKINLALQGGGSHGAFTWGVITRLLEHGDLSIEGISGCSSGAVNGALLAYGTTVAKDADSVLTPLNEFWRELGEVFTHIFTPCNELMGFPGLGENSSAFMLQWFTGMLTQFMSPYVFNPADLNPLRDLLEAHIDFDRLRQNDRIKLFVAATHVRSSKLKIFERNEITVDHILASACLPSIHHAVKIDDEIFWDGGLAGNPPIYPLIFNCHAPDIIIILVNPLQKEPVLDSIEQIREHTAEIAFNSAFMREMRAISFSKRTIRNSWLPLGPLERKLRNIRIHLISAENYISDSDAGSRYNASPNLLRKLHLAGYECAEHWLAENYCHIGHTGSIELETVFE